MKQQGLKERIYKYFLGRPGQFIASGEIQRLVVAHTKDTPRSAVRRMQELAEEGKLTRELRKGHSFYKLAGQRAPTTTQSTLAQNCESCIAAKQAVLNW